ncbi:MAG: DNA repair protein RadA [Candidatus Kerfeldbacteria bacterium]|nr:DNA repair protein RadA [Candidatus Kerfeldbacteria bacterium]
MTKLNTVFICTNCDAQYPKWVGRCSECGKFGTVASEPTMISKNKPQTLTSAAIAASTVSLAQVNGFKNVARFSSGLPEVNRVVGGGFAEASVILLTGAPGVGKSTLVLALAEKCGWPVLYASGEESAEQVQGRVARLGLNGQNLHFTPSTDVHAVIQSARNLQPKLLVIDSLQTMQTDDIQGGVGSPSQIRTVLAELVNLAKTSALAVLVIGHVTKEGIAAGPKTIEHLVDVVLSLEGVEHQPLRFLRANKNRFGPTDEVGVFQMTENGLIEVDNPSALFLNERHSGPGSGVTALIEGSRSLLIEVQALVTRTSSLNYPKRATTGFDANRLQVLLAVLNERARINLGYKDVYINLAGGFRSREPALDLAVCLAVASANFKKVIPSSAVVLGEIGLGGEIRPVVAIDKRLQEAARLGFKQAVVPKLPDKIKLPQGIDIVEVRNITEAVEWL